MKSEKKGFVYPEKDLEFRSEDKSYEVTEKEIDPMHLSVRGLSRQELKITFSSRLTEETIAYRAAILEVMANYVSDLEQGDDMSRVKKDFFESVVTVNNTFRQLSEPGYYEITLPDMNKEDASAVLNLFPLIRKKAELILEDLFLQNVKEVSLGVYATPQTDLAISFETKDSDLSGLLKLSIVEVLTHTYDPSRRHIVPTGRQLMLAYRNKSEAISEDKNSDKTTIMVPWYHEHQKKELEKLVPIIQKRAAQWLFTSYKAGLLYKK